MWSKPPLYLPTKLQKIIETTKDKGKKNKNKCRIIWKLLKFFLSSRIDPAPFLKPPFEAAFLFDELSMKLYKEESVFCYTPCYYDCLLSFVNQHFNCFWIYLKIRSDLCSHQSWVVFCTNIYKYMIRLTNRLYQSVL